MDEDIRKVVESYRRPSLNEIGPLARARGISSASDLWDFFDKIQRLWAERHDYYEGASD